MAGAGSAARNALGSVYLTLFTHVDTSSCTLTSVSLKLVLCFTMPFWASRAGSSPGSALRIETAQGNKSVSPLKRKSNAWWGLLQYSFLFSFPKSVFFLADSPIPTVQPQEEPGACTLNGQMNMVQLIRSNNLFVPPYFFLLWYTRCSPFDTAFCSHCNLRFLVPV